jgi:restriction system protein
VDISFQYPPELFSLLVDAIPKLCKSKHDLLLFFQGAGVANAVLSPHENQLRTKKDDFNKYHVTRDILTALNKKGESGLGERREVLKRVTQFDEFSVCWPADQAAARGLVAQIRELVNVKDSFTRMNLERENERKEKLAAAQKDIDAAKAKAAEQENIKSEFYALFAITDPYKRGKSLEVVLNKLFGLSGILVKEAVRIKGDPGTGVVEQIDGVVQIRGNLFLVEMKWEQDNLGREKVASHLVRVFSRGLAGGIFISYSDYAPAAVNDCKEALREKPFILCRIEEIFHYLEARKNVLALFEAKIDAAMIHKNPYLRMP